MFKLKSFTVFIFLILFSLLVVPTLKAADTTNCSSTTVIEGDDFIIYQGTMTFGAAAGTDDAVSSAFYIGSANESYGSIHCWFTDGSGTEDANGILQYSNQNTVDLTYFSTEVTYGGLDQVQTTAKFDTLGCNAGTDDFFKLAQWMILRFDGQTGNPNSSVLNFYIRLKKNSNAPKRGTAAVKATT